MSVAGGSGEIAGGYGDESGMRALAGLPHQDPFRFVTRIETLERGAHGHGVWVVTGNEAFFRGHFPGRPTVPGVLIGEALAQLSGVVGMEEGAAGHLAQIDVRFREAVRPPAEIVLSSKFVRSLGRVSMYDVEARVEGHVVARGSIVLGASGEP